jgi:hypothetical protein
MADAGEQVGQVLLRRRVNDCDFDAQAVTLTVDALDAKIAQARRGVRRLQAGILERETAPE